MELLENINWHNISSECVDIILRSQNDDKCFCSDKYNSKKNERGLSI